MESFGCGSEFEMSRVELEIKEQGMVTHGLIASKLCLKLHCPFGGVHASPLKHMKVRRPHHMRDRGQCTSSASPRPRDRQRSMTSRLVSNLKVPSGRVIRISISGE